MNLNIMDLIYSIVTGVISGILSGYIVSLYFWNKDRNRLIIQYAEETFDLASLVYESLIDTHESDEYRDVKILFRKGLRRKFDGNIPSELQQSIGHCNNAVNLLRVSWEKDNTQMFLQLNVLASTLLDLNNDIVKFKMVRRYEDEKLGEYVRGFLAITIIVTLVCMAILQ